MLYIKIKDSVLFKNFKAEGKIFFLVWSSFLKLMSKYSQKLYLLGSKYLNQVNYLMKIDDFKQFFNIPDTYSNAEITRSILNKAANDVTDNTVIKIKAKTVKKYKYITHIKFVFTR